MSQTPPVSQDLPAGTGSGHIPAVLLVAGCLQAMSGAGICPGALLCRPPPVTQGTEDGDRGQGTCSARPSLAASPGRAGAAACVRWGELRPAVTVNSQCKLWSLNLAVSVTLRRVRLGLSSYL